MTFFSRVQSSSPSFVVLQLDAAGTMCSLSPNDIVCFFPLALVHSKSNLSSLGVNFLFFEQSKLTVTNKCLRSWAHLIVSHCPPGTKQSSRATAAVNSSIRVMVIRLMSSTPLSHPPCNNLALRMMRCNFFRMLASI